MKQEEMIETAVFSVGPALALLSARCGLKTWLKFEIVSAFVIGLTLISSPKCFLKYLVILLIHLVQ